MGYIGEVDREGNAYGEGTKVHPNGTTWRGTWLNDKETGYLCETGKWGQVVGEAKDGIWNGKRTYFSELNFSLDQTYEDGKCTESYKVDGSPLFPRNGHVFKHE